MIRLVQITDSHLGINQGDKLLSMNPDDSLLDVLNLINQEQTEISLILATGDIVNTTSLSAYQRFYTTVSNHLRAPLAWLPGNHDDYNMMKTVIPAKSQHQRIYKNEWLILMLDSHVPGEIYGNLAKSALDFLASALVENPEKYVLISFHHQPVFIGSSWIDRYSLQNATAFWELINQYSNVKAVLWGHVHQEFDKVHEGIRLMATPSTCIQFAPLKDDFTIEDSMPGYRWIELCPEGNINTGVSRVDRKNYGINFHSNGY